MSWIFLLEKKKKDYHRLLIGFVVLGPPAKHVLSDLAPGAGPNLIEIVLGVRKNRVGKIRKLDQFSGPAFFVSS